jgi:hypothetical protein
MLEVEGEFVVLDPAIGPEVGSRIAGDLKLHFTCPICAVVSMGRRNTQLEPTLH